MQNPFKEGPWQGWYEQPSFGPGRVRMKMDVAASGAHMVAKGTDAVGAFILSGSQAQDSSQVVLFKAYMGGHRVRYAGTLKDDGSVEGQWRIAYGPGLADSGGFRIWPVGGEKLAKRLEAGEKVPVEWVAAEAVSLGNKKVDGWGWGG